jgi:hypothetical protein
VSIAKSGVLWSVTVIENGSTVVETYGIETFARSRADGQRMRLGLKQDQLVTVGR